MARKHRPPKNNVRLVHSNGTSTWGLSANQLNDIVQFESDKEKVLFYILLRRKDVAEVISQPEIIEYIGSKSKEHKHIPDYKVILLDGSIEIHEFSMSERRLKPEIMEREAGARKEFEGRGWKYFVHTENDLPSKTEIEDIRILTGYRPTIYFDPTVAEAISNKLADGNPILINVLSNQLSNELAMPIPDLINTVFHMMWNQDLLYETDKLVIIDGTPNPKVKVWLPK